MSEPRSLTRPFDRLDITLLAVGTLLVALGVVVVGTESLLVPGAYLVLLGSSTYVVTFGLETFTGDALGDGASINEDTGWLIGKLENVLVLTFVLQGEYTALSIVFAAKSWVRRDDISSGNTTYYLAGTLLNFAYALVVGLATLWLAGSGP